MAAKLEELTAIFLCEKHRWGDTVVAECRYPDNGQAGDSLTIKLTAEEDELTPRLSYRFFGHWTEYENKYTKTKEQQFAAKTFVLSSPHGRAGVIRYLQGCPGIGPAIAEKLWLKFKGDAVRILRESPDVAAAAVGGQFSEAKAKIAADDLMQRARLEDCSIDLIDLLGGRGFPRDTAKRAVAEWGNKAPALMRKNPYLLMRFRGAGFLRTDKMYLDLGGNPAALKRQALCAWYTLASDSNGHTWQPVERVVEGLKERIAGSELRPAPAVKLGKRAAMIATRRDESGRLWLAEGKRARHEAYIAERAAEMLATPHQWPDVASLGVSDHQREELSKSLRSPLALFGGSPGTGKTYSLARLVDTIIRRFGHGQVAAAAPTGKAAVRLTELMTGYGVDIRATTIHSLLCVKSKSEGDGWGFEHNEENPLPFRFVVIDESSMVDCGLAAALFRAIAPGTHLLLVGDTNQLPPVGHGAPLRDLIAARVPYGELREIWRNAGTIVRACAAIRDGKPWPTDETIWLPPAEDKETPPRNLKLIPAANNATAAEKIVETLRKLKAKGVDPVWDCQILVAVNEKSELSRKTFNQRLQVELNPSGQMCQGSPFRTADKVVCLKNSWMPVVDDDHRPADCDPGNEDGKVYVANGEIGRVVAVESKRTIVSLDAPKRLIVVPRGKGNEDEGDSNGNSGGNDKAATGCQWDLAYALSTHKSQGSEFPIVLVGLDEYPGARMVCSKNWIYTAISRAKRFCLLFGKRATADGFCRRLALTGRKTFLKELIDERCRQAIAR